MIKRSGVRLCHKPKVFFSFFNDFYSFKQKLEFQTESSLLETSLKIPRTSLYTCFGFLACFTSGRKIKILGKLLKIKLKCFWPMLMASVWLSILRFKAQISLLKNKISKSPLSYKGDARNKNRKTKTHKKSSFGYSFGGYF